MEGNPQRLGGRMLSREEEDHILRQLSLSAQKNKEFIKVLNILQGDQELRPLIFEHEALLKALKDMQELKAEQMLSILTAAETEMYESSKKNEESQQLSRSQGFGQVPKPEQKVQGVQVTLLEDQSSEIKTLKQKVQALTSEKGILEKQVNDLKKESLNAAVKDTNGDPAQARKFKEMQESLDKLQQTNKNLENELE